jgi:hypothetical protein
MMMMSSSRNLQESAVVLEHRSPVDRFFPPDFVSLNKLFTKSSALLLFFNLARTDMTMEKDDLNISKQPAAAVLDADSDQVDDLVISKNVPVKYRGTEADRHDMLVLGRKQVLRRNFNFLTMFGFSSTVMTAVREPRSKEWSLTPWLLRGVVAVRVTILFQTHAYPYIHLF